MPSGETTRRALLGAIVAGVAGAGLASPASSYLRRFAPFSGSVPEAADRDLPGEVDSPHGRAEVRYDDYGVPHVAADDERAAYYAVGFVQAADRLFQMDLQRRRMRGQLSEVVGEATVGTDRFHRKMDFAGAAAANWEVIRDTDTGPVVEAYADGVNRYVREGQLPLEFGLLEFEPDPWTPEDSMLMEKQISWALTGGFRTLRQDVLRGKLDGDVYAELYPERLDHDVPIIRRGETGGEVTAGLDGEAPSREPAAGLDGEPPRRPTPDDGGAVDPALVDWLSRFESPEGVGSNSWVVSGEHTESGQPIVCNDPHLTLMAPPVWYEMDLRPGDRAVRGVTFPGVPFVVIGENDAGAWGFTNVGADVIDFYTYESGEATAADGSSGDQPRDGGEGYVYRGETRAYDEHTETLPVADGEDREVTVRKTVHGPVVEREGRAVAVAWTGLTATRTTVAVHEYARSGGVEDVLAATRKFDLPTQNLVYADGDGRTLYYVTGKLPVRRVGGEPVRGDRVFDGSAGEAEWQGFEPYGESTWEGFVPFEEKPHVVDPEYVGTANQRVVNDPSYYVGESFAPPFRGGRIYERLDRAVAADDPLDPEFVKALQADTYDRRAEHLVPAIVEAAGGEAGSDLPEEAGALVDRLDGWDYRMDRDSRAALEFTFVWEAYREALFADAFEAMDLGPGYWPSDWVVATMDADGPWFDRLGRDRAAVLREAVESAAGTVAAEGYETYGDYNVVDLEHPFQQAFLGYPELPTDGSPATVKNFRVESDVGSSWRMVCPTGEAASVGVLPGGNSGDYFSEHYHDQLRTWADGEYKPMDADAGGEPDVVFGGDGA